jgi:hypothetical protein
VISGIASPRRKLFISIKGGAKIPGSAAEKELMAEWTVIPILL